MPADQALIPLISFEYNKAKSADLLLLTKYENMIREINKRIRFFPTGIKFSFKDRKKFKNFIDLIILQEGKKLKTVNFVFCTDLQLRKLNKTFLNHDYFTDILTFDLSENKKLIIADIYISVDRINENSKIFHFSFNKELHRVMIHGLLHLCGYKDKKKIEKKQIRIKEDKYLSLYFSSRFHVK